MKKIILSICLACRDGCEYKTEKRGGKRLADKIFYKYNKNNFILRGVNCMSQCKRPCVISITSKNNFTYVFGDIVPDNEKYIDDINEFISLYASNLEGFVNRSNRPKLLQSNILGRFPPINSSSSLVKIF